MFIIIDPHLTISLVKALIGRDELAGTLLPCLDRLVEHVTRLSDLSGILGGVLLIAKSF
jgi:hypothetical protein